MIPFDAPPLTAYNEPGADPGTHSRRRDCHFADTPSPCLLKDLLKVEGGAAE